MNWRDLVSILGKTNEEKPIFIPCIILQDRTDWKQRPARQFWQQQRQPGPGGGITPHCHHGLSCLLGQEKLKMVPRLLSCLKRNICGKSKYYFVRFQIWYSFSTRRFIHNAIVFLSIVWSMDWHNIWIARKVRLADFCLGRNCSSALYTVSDLLGY